MLVLVSWGSDILTWEVDVLGFEARLWCQQQAPGMSLLLLQGRGKNGLGERLYPEGYLQLAKPEDLWKWERRFVPLLACLLLGYIWARSIFTAPGKVYKRG